MDSNKLLKSLAEQYAYDNSPSYQLSQPAYHGTGAEFTQYNPEFLKTGEGANKYGAGFYTGSVPEIAQQYADLATERGLQGKVYNVRLPDQSMYYNTDLPFSQQSPYIRQKIADYYKNSQPLDVYDFDYQFTNTDRFKTLVDDFTLNMGEAPRTVGELRDYANANLGMYPQEIFNPMGATSKDYNRLGRDLRQIGGIAGTTHAGNNGAAINITYNPDNIDILQPHEVGSRTHIKANDFKNTYDDALTRYKTGYERAFSPTANKFIANSKPYLLPAKQAAGKALGLLGPVGAALDFAAVVEAAKHSDDRIPVSDVLPLDFDNMTFNQKSDGAVLPLVQIGRDGVPQYTLQGGVKENYILPPANQAGNFKSFYQNLKNNPLNTLMNIQDTNNSSVGNNL